VFLLYAQSQVDELSMTAGAERSGLRSQIRRNQVIGGMAVAVGATLLAGGIVKLVLTERSARKEIAVVAGRRRILRGGRF
jgi:hypothetical protein